MISRRFHQLQGNCRDEASSKNGHSSTDAKRLIEYDILNSDSLVERCAKIIYKRRRMEKDFPNLSLPQLVIRPAKRTLVKTTKSDGETNFKDHQIYEDYFFQPKKLRLHKFTYSFEDFAESYMLLPSTGDNKKHPADLSSQDDLWTTIESSYKALMARDLIKECNETKEDIHVPAISSSSQSSVKLILSVNEFKQKFNQLHDRLHSIHIVPTEETVDECQTKDLQSELHMLKDQAELLKLTNPDLSEDIAKWINILSNKWDLVEKILNPQKCEEHNNAIKDLKLNMLGISVVLIVAAVAIISCIVFYMFCWD